MQNSHLRKSGTEQENPGDKVFHVYSIKTGKGNQIAHCGINLSQSKREKNLKKAHNVQHLYDFTKANLLM